MKSFSTLRLWLAGLLFFSSLVTAQAQTLDPTFQPTVVKAPFIAGLQASASMVIRQPDGKLLTAGGFDFMNGVLAGKITRLNADGTLDATFNPGGTGAAGFIAAMALQPDGKIVIVGGFTAYNNAPAFMIARLNPNGTLDPSFTYSGIGSVRQMSAVALQPDGKILVGSGMSLQGQPETGGIVRLNADGTRDASFNVGTGAGSTGAFIRSILVQADGKIVAGGTFTTFNGQSANGIVRLNANGSTDAGFAVGAGATNATSGSTVRTIVQQPDGKLLIGGDFTEFNGVTSPRLVRLELTGAVDNSLALGAGFNSGGVFSLLLTSTNDILVGGSFTQYNGVARTRLARISSTGTLDATFGAAGGANGNVNSIVSLGNNQYAVGGTFTQYQTLVKPSPVRLDASGVVDPAFAPTTEVRAIINSVTPLTGGAMLIAGNFVNVNGVAFPNSTVRRLNADGSINLNYNTTATTVYGAQPDGTFYTVNTPPSGGTFQIQKVLPSGAIDAAFTSLPFGIAAVGAAPLQGITVQPDGKLLVYGNFRTFGTASRNSIVRLNPDGTLDNSFNPPASTVTRTILPAFVQPDGKIVIVYTEFGTGAALGTFLARLNPDGTLDNTFSVGSGSNGVTYSVLMQPNGQLLVTGAFGSFNGQPATGSVRLTATGAIDNSFVSSNSFLPRVVQPDGRIIAQTGRYENSAIVRLNANGSVDNSFTPIALPVAIFTGDDLLSGITLQPADGKILLFGSFRSVLGQPRIGLARINNPGVTATRSAKDAEMLTLYPNPARQQFTLKLPVVKGAFQGNLLDVQGRVVRTCTWPGNQGEATVNVAGLPAGMYLLKLTSGQASYFQKVVVAH
ncbi:T9SS type A sorting domain-containing protein [Hymenobacter koreensis]|uniref:Secretion system C-terminal sorting domain-containing protein n=1 Tax=Hymenobacter koreensis TaxID=1084523 RepID=A0ABP8IT31_9BACT